MKFAKWLVSPYGTIDRKAYLTVGVSLGLLKYVVESSVLSYASGRFYTPLDFISPLFSAREPYVATAPLELTLAWIVWTLPFLWISVSMTVRRAFDSRVSPWWALSILVPIVNLVAMLIFVCLPSRESKASIKVEEAAGEEVNPFEVKGEEYLRPPIRVDRKGVSGVLASVLGISAGAVYLLILVLLSVYVIHSYGAAMFFGAPIVTCATAAFYLNRYRNCGIGRTILHSLATLLVACTAFLLIGIEGGICIVMAIPIFAPLGLLGATVGFTIAVSSHGMQRDEVRGLYGCLVVLPLIGFIESRLDRSPLLEVRSEVVIEASAARVWEHVIRFPDITSPPTGILATGVAYPVRARIEGEGVGAIRYCEFSTGEFVEPITRWEEPHRLSFDVTSQPEPMTELSPYRHIHPPHLDGSFKSVRGEFRLIALGENRTRLEGSTWYRVDMGPRVYWRLWTDSIVHQIHHRVLEHIRKNAEVDGKANGE